MTTVAALVTPAAFAVLVRTLGLLQPVSAGAAVQSPAVSPVDAAPIESAPDARSLAARRRAEARRLQPPSSNPMHYPEATTEPEKADVNAPPGIELSAVMGGRQPVAVIDGRLQRVGDEVAAGWTIHSIDALARTVIITGPGGESITIAQSQD